MQKENSFSYIGKLFCFKWGSLHPKRTSLPVVRGSYFLLRINIFTLNRIVLRPKKNFALRRTEEVMCFELNGFAP